jgi:hypothetical protein
VDSNGTPQMSVIVLTPDNLASVSRLVAHLQAQTVKEKLEVVIIVPSVESAGLNEVNLEGLGRVQVVEMGAFTKTAQARALGIRRAAASIIALTEEHSFPRPDWAEVLIEAHQERWAAVGPAMENANPHSLLSWANLLIEYAPWVDPVSGGVTDYLPGHNSSYKRDVLLDYDAELGRILEAEYVLHSDLKARGYELYLEPAAKTQHLNFSAPWSWISLRLNDGIAFAALRSAGWSIPRRMVYAAASPLIPCIRLGRIMRHIRRLAPRHKLMPRIVPVLIAVLVISGIGEMLGYIFGEGQAAVKLSQMEFDRVEHLSQHDRESLAI